MLQDAHACRYCWLVDTCTLYHAAAEGGDAASSGLGPLFDEKTAHLSDEKGHLRYFREWDHMLDLEASGMHAFRRRMWTVRARAPGAESTARRKTAIGDPARLKHAVY